MNETTVDKIRSIKLPYWWPVCSACEHRYCPACLDWCDTMDGEDLCCDGSCSPIEDETKERMVDWWRDNGPQTGETIHIANAE